MSEVRTFLGARIRLPEERAQAEWTRVRRHDCEELWRASLWPNTQMSYAARVSTVLELVERLGTPGSKVLDVGCAQGTLASCLAHRGFRVTGLDTRAEYIEYAQERSMEPNVSFVCADIRHIDEAESYDVVVATEFLEHVKAPGHVLEVLSRGLKQGGALVLTTPNASYFRTRLPSYGNATESDLSSLEDASADGDSHRYLFTALELRILLRAQGFEVMSAGWMLPFWLEGHLKLRLLYRLLGERLATALLARLPVKTKNAFFANLFVSQWVVARKHFAESEEDREEAR